MYQYSVVMGTVYIAGYTRCHACRCQWCCRKKNEIPTSHSVTLPSSAFCRLLVCFVLRLAHTNNNSNTSLMAICLGLPRCWYQKGTTSLELLEQEIVSGSGAICKSAPRPRPITTPVFHHLVFLQAGCPSCRPTNSVKAIKAIYYTWNDELLWVCS